MLRANRRSGAVLHESEKRRPVSSYDEYVRTYLPGMAEEATQLPDADPAKVAEEVGRDAVKRAIASLTSSEPSD